MSISKLLFLRLFRWFPCRTLLSLSLVSFLLLSDLHKIAFFHHLPSIMRSYLLFGVYLLWLWLLSIFNLTTLLENGSIESIYWLFSIFMLLRTLSSFRSIVCFTLSSLHSIKKGILDKNVITVFDSRFSIIVLLRFVGRFILYCSLDGPFLLLHLSVRVNVLLAVLSDVLRYLAGEAGYGHATAGHDCVVLSIT